MWYLFQIAVFVFIIEYYKANNLAVNGTLGHLIFFAFLVTYASTWLLSKLFDLLLLFRRLLQPRPSQGLNHHTSLGVKRGVTLPTNRR